MKLVWEDRCMPQDWKFLSDSDEIFKVENMLTCDDHLIIRGDLSSDEKLSVPLKWESSSRPDRARNPESKSQLIIYFLFFCSDLFSRSLSV